LGENFQFGNSICAIQGINYLALFFVDKNPHKIKICSKKAYFYIFVLIKLAGKNRSDMQLL